MLYVKRRFIPQQGLWYAAGSALELPSTIQPWLLDIGSLTARLKQCCDNFQVEILNQDYAEISADEQQALGVDGPYWVREVLLKGNQQPWVYARSIVPQTSLDGEAAQILELNSQPLGELLFSHPDSERQELELALLPPHSLPDSLQVQQRVWARRSRFLLASCPLLVSEVFLPDCPVFPEAQHAEC
ncbi:MULTISPECIES: chorismate--pyruvate lyase family protein [Aliagarivorans]|uniref:chorismate--pyruvate lyase family protein n=1 Tax=Aliagarivorans TaxID=882379 RepID=UPI0003F81756|nr:MULTISPECIES: chorismate lyase [Aliagarivorans]